MQERIPPSLVREQLPAITGMTAGLFWSLTPPAIKTRLVDQNKPRTVVVNSGSDRLVDHYVRWCGVDDDRYDGVLPPHFFCKYGMSLVARLTGLAPYNMANAVNQGCRMQVNGLIPRGQPVHLRGELVDIREQDQRARVHTRVTAGTEAQPEALVVDSLAAVMLGKPAKKKKTRSADKTEYETVGHWSAGRDEGQKFFFLTGDYNPIHTFWPIAKRSRFGGCILHGFASYARTYETIQNAGYTIRDIDIRFVKPNLLPSPELSVQIGSQKARDGRRALRLINPEGDVLLAGHFLEAAHG